MTQDEISRLAGVADKYNFYAALRPAAHLWCADHVRTTTQASDAKLLGVAVVFRQPELIRAWSMELVLHATYLVDNTMTTGNRIPAVMIRE